MHGKMHQPKNQAGNSLQVIHDLPMHAVPSTQGHRLHRSRLAVETKSCFYMKARNLQNTVQSVLDTCGQKTMSKKQKVRLRDAGIHYDK